MKAILRGSFVVTAALAALGGCSKGNDAAQPTVSTPKVAALVKVDTKASPATCTLAFDAPAKAGRATFWLASEGVAAATLVLVPASGASIALGEIAGGQTSAKEVDLPAGEYGATCTVDGKAITADKKLAVS